MDYKFSFTANMVQHLQVIERARAEVGLITLPPAVAEDLRMQARVRSTHFSTRIEGNRLTLQEAAQVTLEGKRFIGRERDTLEVKHYFQALAEIEKWVDEQKNISQEKISQLHAMLYTGKRKATPYRDGQNVIRDSAGGIVYLPPESKDVPNLMKELVDWIYLNETKQPIPIVAGIAHYQFVTIHPFYDGNGRTARTLATWLLYRSQYDLGRFYALEEFYAKDLQGYYDALQVHPHHNYYEGRAFAEMTSWLEYFVKGMADVFESVAQEVRLHAIKPDKEFDAALRKLDRRARIVLGLFSKRDEITAKEVALALSLSERQTRELLTEWTKAGWLQVSDSARKSRRYHLSAEYRRFIG
jgi:Fic family protein